MEEKQQVYDTAIIGGGLAGLTAAALLAREGYKVIVLEKAAKLGGRGGTTIRDCGMLNFGPHALYRGAEAMQIWKELGVMPRIEPINFKVLAIADERDYRMTTNPVSIMISSLLSIPDKFELAAFYGGLGKLKPAAYAHLTVAQFLQSRFKRPRVRRFMEALIRTATYSADFDRIGADAAIGQLKSADTLYVHGGWRTIVEQLLRRATEWGVVVREQSSVKSISGRQPELTIHLGDGELIAARTVVSTAGPQETAELFAQTTDSRHKPLLNGSITPVKAACLDLVLSHLPNPDIQFTIDMDQPFYYSVHSKIVSLTSDPAHHVIHVMKYLKAQEPAHPEQNKSELMRYMSRLQPGWERHLLHMRYLPHITVSNMLPLVEHGSLGGRPDPAVDRDAGLYAAGDWVGAEGLLVNASIASAKKAAEYIMESLGMGAARKTS